MATRVRQLEADGVIQRRLLLDQPSSAVAYELTDAGRELAIRVNEAMHDWEDRLALPVRSRERIDAQLDALLAVFED